MQIQRVSELTPEPISWMWKGRLGLGKLCILDGDPGLGKSLLALDLCARLSRGQSMPDGSPGPGVCNSLVLAAEDGMKDTIRPRLQTLGADPERVFVVRQGERGELARLPGETAELEAALTEADARLLVLDPVIAFLESGVAVNSDQSVRRALLPLFSLAERRNCVVLMTRHLNKRVGPALYRGGGSIGFHGVCRSAYLLAEDPAAPSQRRVLAELKNNLGPKQPALSLEVVSEKEEFRALNWLGESLLTANELVGNLGRPAKPTRLQRARDFLVEFLQNGPRRACDIWQAGVRRGLTKRTLQRAQQDLQIKAKWVHEDNVPHTYWLLPGQRLPGEDPDPNSMDGWLRGLEEKYPGRTPLDLDPEH